MLTGCHICGSLLYCQFPSVIYLRAVVESHSPLCSENHHSTLKYLSAIANVYAVLSSAGPLLGDWLVGLDGVGFKYAILILKAEFKWDGGAI